MVMPEVKQRILDDLDRLPREKQLEAAQMVHSLVSTRPRGATVEEVMSVTGLIDHESAEQMRRAIEEGCERIDRDEW